MKVVLDVIDYDGTPTNPPDSRYRMRRLGPSEFEIRHVSGQVRKTSAAAAADQLRHRIWQVRLTAAEALAKFRVPDALEALVARIPAGEEPEEAA